MVRQRAGVRELPRGRPRGEPDRVRGWQGRVHRFRHRRADPGGDIRSRPSLLSSHRGSRLRSNGARAGDDGRDGGDRGQGQVRGGPPGYIRGAGRDRADGGGGRGGRRGERGPGAGDSAGDGPCDVRGGEQGEAPARVRDTVQAADLL